MNDVSTEQVRRATSRQYVIFCLGETRFSVEINQVLRIVRLTPITRVPRAPHFLEGVINYRGRAVPVVDLRKRLALPSEQEYGDAARILIVELAALSQTPDQETQTIGMLVDAVIGISRLSDESIEPPPKMVAQVNGVYLTGVAHDGERLVVLLDLSRVLAVEEATETFASLRQTTNDEQGKLDA